MTGEPECYDARFKNPSSIVCAGGSSCGKTTLVLSILRDAHVLFEDPRCSQNIIYYYREYQPKFDEFKKENIVREWVPKLPTVEDVKEKTLPYKHRGGSIIVIDDWGEDLNKDISTIFSVISHHTNTVAILLVQNLYLKNPVFRDISLNAMYIILFKSPRDGTQIRHFAQQFQPGESRWVVEAFQRATQKPYSYLLFDLHQTTPNEIRVRTDFLCDIVTIYKKK